MDCCVRCENACDVDDEDDCIDCSTAGSVLETLDVERGWWRATAQSLKVYECPFDRACRGGVTTAGSAECFAGHFGALCGACKSEYDYDIAQNRCAPCKHVSKMMRRVTIIFLLLVVIALGFLSCVRTAVHRDHFHHTLKRHATLALKGHAKGDGDLGESSIAHLEAAVSKVGEQKDANDGAVSERSVRASARRHSLLHSMLTKLCVPLSRCTPRPETPLAARSS